MIANFYLLSMHIPLNCPSLIYFECWGPLPLSHLAHHSLERDDKCHQSWVETTSSPHFSSGIARASEAAQRVKITPREKSERPFHEISFDAQLKTRTDIAKISLPRAKEFFNEDMDVADAIAILAIANPNNNWASTGI